MRIAIYVRVSTQRQAQAQTIEQQLDRLQSHLQSQGWQVRDENIFRDDGYSGASLNRPGLDRLRDQVKAAEIDRILITAPDRLARNYVHQMVLLEEFAQHGVDVEFLEHPMSQDPNDQLLLQIRGAVAEYERTLIAERMRRGRQTKMRAGILLPWTRPPYGYQVNPDRPRDPAGVRLDPAAAAAVHEMFVAYAQDHVGLFTLAKHLQALGLPTPQGETRWNPGTIRYILSNPVYTGQVYAGRKCVQTPRLRHSPLQPISRQPGGNQRLTPPETWIPVASVPPIIPPELFDQVHAKLAHNQVFARRNNTAHAYLLRALVSCGICHLSCVGRTASPGYTYYTCRGKDDPINSRRAERCLARFAPAHQLDDVVWQDLCQVLTHPESIAYALERAHGGHWVPQELQERRNVLRQGQASLEHQIARLTEAYLNTVIPLAEYQRRRQELEQKQRALQAQIERLEAQGNHQAELAGLVTSIQEFCQRVQAGLSQATFEQKRELVELLIDRVVVTNDEVEIRYVIPTSAASEHVRFCHLRSDYLDRMSVEEQNAVIYDQHRDEPLAEVLAESRAAHEKLLQGVAAQTEAFLTQPQTIEGASGPSLVWQMLESDVYGHYPDHIGSVKQWLEESSA